MGQGLECSHIIKKEYNMARPLIHDVLFHFLSEVPVTNWTAQ